MNTNIKCDCGRKTLQLGNILYHVKLTGGSTYSPLVAAKTVWYQAAMT